MNRSQRRGAGEESVGKEGEAVRHDLVVIVPGIMGSTLHRGGGDVWDLTPQALGRLRRPDLLLDALRLPAGIGDAEPDAAHALTPGSLVRRPRVLPGLLSHLGYRELCEDLRIEPPERLAAFPYDWRLSNRTSAARLKAFVERRLASWRETAQARSGEDDAKVVFICRSMGGLVAKYYVEVLGGREVTRTLVTLGTPHQGSAKAIRVLTGSLGRAVPPRLAESVAEVCRTLPSLAQLLPVYRAAVDPALGRVMLNDIDVPGLETAWVRDAFAFHRRIRDARARNDAAGAAPYAVRPLGGGTHGTVHAVSVAAGRIDFLEAFPEPGDWRGDSTVPEISATPVELGSTSATMWHPYRHAAMANERPVLLQLRKICDDLLLTEALASDDEFGITVPDAVGPGEPIEVVASSADRGLGLTARLLDDEGRCRAAAPLSPAGPGHSRGELRAPAGIWTVEVVSPAAGLRHRDAVLVTES